MKLGDVLKKEREKRALSAAEVAAAVGLDEAGYGELEAGATAAETWGPRLAELAIRLETPTSRLIADSGRASDARPGQVGALIRRHRERREVAAATLAAALGLSAAEYAEVEAGRSPLETYAPMLLAFAERVEQPVFNLFYPCGLPFQELEDYP